MPRHGSLVKKLKVKPKKPSDFAARDTGLVMQRLFEFGYRFSNTRDHFNTDLTPVMKLKSGLYQVKNGDGSLSTGQTIGISQNGRIATREGIWESRLADNTLLVKKYASPTESGFSEREGENFAKVNGRPGWSVWVDQRIMWRKHYDVDGNLISSRDFSQNAEEFGVSEQTDTAPKNPDGLVPR